MLIKSLPGGIPLVPYSHGRVCLINKFQSEKIYFEFSSNLVQAFQIMDCMFDLVMLKAMGDLLIDY
jgi:hypothetical protein